MKPSKAGSGIFLSLSLVAFSGCSSSKVAADNAAQSNAPATPNEDATSPLISPAAVPTPVAPDATAKPATSALVEAPSAAVAPQETGSPSAPLQRTSAPSPDNIVAVLSDSRPHAFKVVEEWAIPNGGSGRAIVIAPFARTEANFAIFARQLWRATSKDRNAVIFVFDDELAASSRKAWFDDRLSNDAAARVSRRFFGSYTRNGNTGFHEFSAALTEDGDKLTSIKVR